MQCRSSQEYERQRKQERDGAEDQLLVRGQPEDRHDANETCDQLGEFARRGPRARNGQTKGGRIGCGQCF